MRTDAKIKKEVLAREVFDYFFCDENGNQSDELCARRDTVVEQFPQTAEWPIVEPIVGEYSDRFGCVLGNGVYLFPDFSFGNPAFTVI